ncbi:MAG: hypothetical protein ACFB6S_08295 [Geminicoccaceae bacterium]
MDTLGQPDPVESQLAAEASVGTDLNFDGIHVRETLLSEDNLVGVFSVALGEDRTSDFKKRNINCFADVLQVLEQRKENESLEGAGALLAHSFIDVVDKLGFAKCGIRTFDDIRERIGDVSIIYCGRIRDYRYDPTDGSGGLTVETYATCRVIPPSGLIGPSPVTTAYRWTIQVKEGGFFVDKKRSDDDPFPNSPVDVTAFGNPVMNARINAFDFDHKLIALGPNIVVKKVERAFAYPQNPIFEELDPAEHPRFYRSHPEDCIDMLFKGPPKETLATLGKPPSYCLGRCKFPPIVNTS